MIDGLVYVIVFVKKEELFGNVSDIICDGFLLV